MNKDYEIRIVIAEDEPIILNNIEKKAKKAGNWVTVVGKAESGGEALALLETCSADILITDIEMPGINGLELIRQVRERYPCMKIIVLSGYSSFEYAQTALRYGVNDYLLKPVAQDVLDGLLLKLKAKIMQEAGSRKREILSRALNNFGAKAEVPSDLQMGSFYLLYLLIGNYAGPSVQPDIAEDYLYAKNQISIEECLKNMSGINHMWRIEEAYPLSDFFILSGAADTFKPGYLKIVLQKYLSEKLSGLPFLLLIYGEPISYSMIWTASKSLREIAAQYSRPFRQEVWLSKKIPEECICDQGLYAQTFAILHSLTGAAAFLQYAEKNISEIIEKGCPSQLMVKFFSEIFTAAGTNFQIDSNICRNALSSVLSEFYRYQDRGLMREHIMKELSSLLENDCVSGSGDSLCTKITQYIQSNYCSRLSLNDLVEHFGYTASYINRIFKKEMGISPLQYITDLKMKKAKELLRADTGMDIKEIASFIGYEDARYFSRVFKNETGMTPTAWGGL